MTEITLYCVNKELLSPWEGHEITPDHSDQQRTLTSIPDFGSLSTPAFVSASPEDNSRNFSRSLFLNAVTQSAVNQPIPDATNAGSFIFLIYTYVLNI